MVCPTTVDPEHPDSYYSVARRLTDTTPGAFMPNQYANPHNPEAHERTTGPELWRQTAGRITHLVAGIGTGGHARDSPQLSTPGQVNLVQSLPQAARQLRSVIVRPEMHEE